MEEPRRNQHGDLIRKILPGFLVSAVVIGVLIYFVDFSELVGSFRYVSFFLILIIFLIQSLAFVFRGLAWRLILEKRPTLKQCYFTIAEGYLLNLLPLRLGEVGRSVIMGGIIGKSPFYVLSTVILERVFDILVTLVFLFVTIPMVSGAAIPSGLYYGLFIAILLGLSVLYFAIKKKEFFLSLIGKIFKKDTKLGGIVYSTLDSMLNGVQILAAPLLFLQWLLWILLTWACWAGTMIISIHVFFPALPKFAPFFVQGITALGGAIPAAPAGMGVIEGAFVAALRFFDVGQSVALGYGVFVHAMGVITPTLWGVIGIVVQGQDFKKIFSDLKNVQLKSKD